MATVWDQIRIDRPVSDLGAQQGTYGAPDLPPPPPQAMAPHRSTAWDRAMATKQRYEQNPSSVPPAPVRRKPNFLSQTIGWLGVAALPIGAALAGYACLAYLGGVGNSYEQKKLKFTLAEKSEKGIDKKWAKQQAQMQKDFQYGALSFTVNKAKGRDPSSGPVNNDTLRSGEGMYQNSMPPDRSFEYNVGDTLVKDGPRGHIIRSASVNDKDAPSMINSAYEQATGTNTANSSAGTTIHVPPKRGGR